VKRTLLLGPIPEDFSPDTHLPIAPSCFIGREDIYPGWEHLSFEPDPFATPAELASASGLTSDYANGLIKRLTVDQNRRCGTDYSEASWRLLAMPWLLCLVQSTWERQCRLQAFIRRHGDEPLRVVTTAQPPDWRFASTTDFIARGVLNPSYNEWLYSQLLDGNQPASWEVVRTGTLTTSTPPDPPSDTWRTRIKRAVWSRSRCLSVHGISPAQSLLWSLLLSLKPRWPASVSNSPAAPTELPWLLDFDELLSQTRPSFLDHVQRHDPVSTKGPSGRVTVVGPILYYDETAKVNLAHRIEAGEQLVTTQHGGNYGVLKSAPYLSEIEYRHAAFLSWGWQRHEEYEGRFFPAPSPFLHKLTKRRRPGGDELIVIGTQANLFSHRLDSSPQALQQLAYRREKRDFFKAIPPSILAKTRYRPYANEDGSLRDRSYFAREFRGLRILDGDLTAAMMRCRLLVVDHPVTSLAIAMATNTPMIGFWDEEAWHFSEQAQPLFDTLSRAGVFHQTGAAAAAQVQTIWSDVDSWWRQDSIQAARKRWCEQFADTAPFWWWRWMKLLWTLQGTGG